MERRMPEFAIRARLTLCMALASLALAACSTPQPTPSKAGNRLPPELVEVRKRMVAGEPVAFAEVKQLADHDDGYAAWILAERLYDQQRWDIASDVAHYYAVAAASGRTGGARRLVDILERPEFDPAGVTPQRMAWLEETLTKRALAGDPGTAAFLVTAYAEGAPFGRKPDAAVALLEALGPDQGAELALNTATALLRTGGLTASNRDLVRDLLELASADDSLEAQVTTSNLAEVIDSRMPAADQPDTGDYDYAME